MNKLMSVVLFTSLVSLLYILVPQVSADEINLGTGEYIMDMGDGDKMNLDTGDYIMDLD